MLKEPRAGRVKSRLGREIGMTEAAWWMRHQTKRLLRQLDDPRWRLVLSVAPDTAVASRAWPAHLRRVPQGRGDLGTRMARALSAMPPGPVVLIGGDIPAVTPAHIARALRRLGACDAVFGPAEDGGFWLVGLRGPRVPSGFFQGVRWSTEHALVDALATLPGRRVGLADTLRDVDRAADLGARPGAGKISEPFTESR
ncbi:hypothetical protein AIOL_000800 [Candidatus Rhodobacter oscarellae]|uniref:Glycosyltransferase n=2 Tax=Candidatus Rhodobacter oscarellae TaxID=1675527 RepID=A0A0J9ED94_9RHOB|nr:hypothetical protein AIOL_000800 [Candidatus Rhodobacter lobularis]